MSLPLSSVISLTFHYISSFIFYLISSSSPLGSLYLSVRMTMITRSASSRYARAWALAPSQFDKLLAPCRKNLSKFSCLVPRGMKRVCTCCRKRWCVSLTGKSVAGALLAVLLSSRGSTFVQCCCSLSLISSFSDFNSLLFSSLISSILSSVLPLFSHISFHLPFLTLSYL